MLTLNIPPKRDPIARLSLIACAALVAYAAFVSATAPQQAAAQSDIIIIEATPTPALPTPSVPMGFAVAVPTPTPALSEQPAAAPSWVDQALGAVGTSVDQFVGDQAAALADEQDAAAQAQYLANVGAQAEHSPRGDVSSPAAFVPGMVAQPVNADNEIIIIDPQPSAQLAGIAEAVPQISAEQSAVLAQRQSNGCAAGQVFYPRTGCHTPGSGGGMPGAVGTP